MNWIKGIMVAGIAAVSMSATMDANAGDGKSFPGTFCQAESVGVHMGYTRTGRAQNPSSSTMYVVCPIVRDAMTKGIAKANVIVYDRHYSRNLSCTLNSRDQNGGTMGYYKTVSSSGSNSTRQVLRLGRQGAFSYGIYFMRCAVPGKYANNRSEIASYYMEE